jgi:hypothetical protein
MMLLKNLVGGLDQFAIDMLIGKLTSEKRDALAKGLKDWLANTARKKDSMHLASYIQEFNRRIDVMAETLELEVVDGKPVVKALGSNDATLKALERGTNWFDPCEDVVSVMISALWKS